jgi:nucleotide-binding universal stress UspA family protein
MTARSVRQAAGCICPIAFSEHSSLALRYTELVAQRANATLTVTFVNDPLLVAAAGSTGFVNATLGRTTARRLKASVSIGAPILEIIKTAASQSSDLIVMGTHGLTGVTRAVVGSATLGVLQRTDVPVPS